MACGEWGKNHFWEDQWFGSCSLAIQFWNLYSIVNEHGKTLKEAWDGDSLKFTFRRTVDRRTLEQWHELTQIASVIQFSDDKDAMIWQFDSKGRFSVQWRLNRFLPLLCGKFLCLLDYTSFCGC
jgi:hypothetical protein